MDEVTAAQAAVLTGFSERTIRRKIASGELPARRLAPNRYAIDVCDLPQRWDDRDVARRIDALERRVRLVEERQRALLRRLGASAGEGTAEAEPEATVDELRDLLALLAEQTERLGPLLARPVPEQMARPGRGSGRQARGTVRTLHGGTASGSGA